MPYNATYCCQGVTAAVVIDAVVAVIVVVVVVVARNPWNLSWLNNRTDLQQGINDVKCVCACV